MTAPTGFQDFYELELKINYNNSADYYLQGPLPGTYQPPQERQAGWTEKYYLYNLGAAPDGTNLPFNNAYALIQARASLLGLNFFIKTAICHQGAVFKSSWPLAGSAKYALFDSLGVANTGGTLPLTPQFCSSPEETFMLRLESGNLRRWEHQIRGIKDYLSDDAMSYFPATSYADATTQAQTSIFDSAAPGIPFAAANGGTAATLTITNTSGAASLPVVVTPGLYPGVAAGTYFTYFNSTVGQTIQAFGTVMFANGVGGGTVSSATIYSWAQGTGYQGNNVTIPLSNDPYGLPNWQPPQTYWSNFLSCLIAYTGSGQMRRVASNRFTAPVPLFPSGMAPVIVNALVPANRAMLQRIGNRQTGQIRLTKPARVKRGI